jgi:hypothetical protein
LDPAKVRPRYGNGRRWTKDGTVIGGVAKSGSKEWRFRIGFLEMDFSGTDFSGLGLWRV